MRNLSFVLLMAAAPLAVASCTLLGDLPNLPPFPTDAGDDAADSGSGGSNDAGDGGVVTGLDGGHDATVSDGGDGGGAGGDGGNSDASDANTTAPSCDISGKSYAPDAANPNNACQLCEPKGTGGASGWSNATNGIGCGNGQICFNGACGTACAIDGGNFDSGALDPGNPCMSCQPGVNLNGWTGLSVGTGCGGMGEFCNGSNACVSECYIDGGAYAPDATMNNGCLVCEPSVHGTTWTTAPNGMACGLGAGDICQTGACANECYIGDVFYSANEADPDAGCQSCQPTLLTSGWSANNGVNEAACGATEVCNGGGCVSGCFIDGGFYAPDAAAPGNGCLSCQPSLSVSEWSNANGVNEAACGATEVCNGGGCVGGCFIDGGYEAPDAANPNVACSTCQPTDNLTIWTAGSCSQTFTYTGSSQSFVVPIGITQVTIAAYGSAGETRASASSDK